MNNREWLNTLSDEERQKIEIEKFDSIIDSCGYGSFSHIDVNVMFYKYQEWLQSPRPTTADEDYDAIGFDLEEVGESFAKYSDAFGRSFEIWENDIKFKTCSDPIKIWNNRNIDQIRKIAEKKRKEMGWGE